MCNSLHKTSKAIPKSGDGWKIFRLVPSKPLMPLFSSTAYISNKDGSISYKDMLVGLGDGFCFFLTEREAKRAMKLLVELNPTKYSNLVAVKIKYNRGLGTHCEKHFISGKRFQVALCGNFRIHKDSLAMQYSV